MIGALTLSLGSCVTNKKYAALQAEYQTTRDGLLECNTKSKSMTYVISDLKKQNEELKKSLADMKSTLDQSMANNQQGNVNIAKLVDEINASNKYIKELISAKSKSDSLNIALTNKLTRSLTNDELKDVDVKVLKGVVYISLADNMPISRTNIRNNWDLSALRASSVVQCLQNDFGINPSRLSAAGRGEFNPIADNDSEVGKQRNRRTEIIITPKLDQFLDLIDHAPKED